VSVVVDDTRTIVRQVGYEQRSFWRTPQTALFIFALPIVFMVMFNSLNKGNHLHPLGGVSAVQYFVPSMLAYGLMSVCFVNLAIQMTVRREDGLLKRVRGTPLTPASFMSSVIGNVVVISAIDVAIALLIGKLAFSLRMPAQWAPFALSVVVGVVAFSALGLAISCFVPNAEAAPAIVNLPFLVLLVFSGAFYPFPKGSFVSHVANFFPVTHFIGSLYAPFDPLRTGSSFAGRDVLVVAIWGVVGAVIALRRFSWEPRRK
jgi:ABC-2 type transport system permease protein